MLAARVEENKGKVEKLRAQTWRLRRLARCLPSIRGRYYRVAETGWTANLKCLPM